MLKTVKDACVLQPNALEMRVSDQIEQIDAIIRSENEAQEFFDKTFITQGMRTLITEGIARLAGRSNQAVFHLKQAMGGGKTHLLIGFGFLAKHSTLRASVCPEVPYINAFGSARIAAFNGRNTNVQFYFWGDLANQLGKGELFRNFWASGPKAPDEQDWLKLFEGDEPTLILLDEMPPYFHYLNTQPVGNGTVADIATRAFANMLTAAGKKANVCIVVTDLGATYDQGSKLIGKSLEDARQELGRQERNITPVDLTGNEVYDILRKRLFKNMPDISVIHDVAEHFGRSLEEATKAKVANRGAEAIADEIVDTYPFHPRLKNLVALFKENEKFKQTRGLIELISRLLKSVWERKSDDVFLIGPQHFDLSISDVREKLSEISEMRDVIAKDLWDVHSSAHAQIIDLKSGNDTALQVGTLLLTASLSTAVNAVKGLTKEEMVECLIAPLRNPSDFLKAFEELESSANSSAWYLHHTPESRYYFDRQENLTKLLQSLAQGAPENQIDDLIKHKLTELFRPTRKTVYEDVLPLPNLNEIADRIRRGRVLLIVSPDAKLPPEAVQRFFEVLTEKNNVCVLSGEKTRIGNVESAARQVFAAKKADLRIPKGHLQREELERKQQQYEQDFFTTITTLFDKVFFPRQLPSKDPVLAHKPLDMTRDQSRPFNGEDQIQKTLTSDPIKLYLDVDQAFDSIRDKAEGLLWPGGQDDTRWSDLQDRMSQQAAMPWLPPKALESLKAIACNRGLWEDLGNGYLTKRPKKKKTSVQCIPESDPDDNGLVRLRVNPLNAGPAPRIHYAEGGAVSEQSPVMDDTSLETKALRVSFLVVDPSGQFEMGAPTVWTNKIVLRNKLFEEGSKRKVELLAAPIATIHYTMDGSEARNGIVYESPIEVGEDEVHLWVYAEAEGIEAKTRFDFSARGKKGILIDDVKPARLEGARYKKLDSRQKTFEGLIKAKEMGIAFEKVMLAVGQGTQLVQIMVGDIKVTAQYIEDLLNIILQTFEPNAPMTMSFQRAYFASGHDLKQFSESLEIDLQQGEVHQ